VKKLFLFAAFLGLTLVARAQDFSFIVHPDFAETAITSDDMKQVLLGNLTKWRRGTVIKLAVLTEGAVHTKVVRDYTQRTPDQFDKYWKRQVFTGAGILPFQAKSDAEVIAYVAANPGAVGYVATASATDKVRILQLK
jgi:ABC-type phosphate transport system substrate-binding protein